MHFSMSFLTPQRAAALRRERERLVAQLSGFSRVLHGSSWSGSRRALRVVVTGPAARPWPTWWCAGKPNASITPQRQIVGTAAIARYRLMALVDRLSTINLQLMRGGRFDDAHSRRPP
jgi:hypothetical protein